ncbi:MAG: isochorismate synthase [Flavobacteriaceae bacterium]
MSLQHLAKEFKRLMSDDQAFVFYRLPNTKTVHCFYQNDALIHQTEDLKIKGFVMSRFDTPIPSVFIPDENHLQFDSEIENLENPEVAVFDHSEDKSSFINIVNKTKQAITSKQLKKLVVARRILKKEKVDGFQLFSRLLSLYSNAMVYFWHHPKVGTWVGATPEQLFSLDSGRLSTMALAGTMPYQDHGSYSWGTKEKKEQRWVKDALQSDLESLFDASEVHFSETYTRRAGNLVHLCNDLTVHAREINIANLVKKLHPTPAVGGIPVEEGMRFLSKHENLDRAYYAGFLGPILESEKIDLFVNLRCAQMTEEGLILYVGAGITSESDPEKEWEETQHKAKTLLAALSII